MTGGPDDPFLTNDGKVDPLAESARLLDALGELKRTEGYGPAFLALDTLEEVELRAVALAAMFERASDLDAEDRKRGVDERWARRRRLSRACRLAWAAFRLEMGR